VTAELSEPRGAGGVEGDPDLELRLETPAPRPLPVGRATAVFCLGWCFHRRHQVEELELIIDGERHRPAGSRMPRLDVFRAHPELPSYRSGFWATIPIEARDRPGAVELRAEVRLAGGGSASARLATIEVVRRDEPPSYPVADRGEEGLIAICMATFEPDAELFRVQVDSIRDQTDTNWVCLISDDCSSPERFEAIEGTVAADPRFVVSRSPERLGFYRNFERALEMVPAEAELVGLSDHDDHWYPDKLEALRGAIGAAQLAYSDQRLVDADGRVLADTLWSGRRNNFTSFPSLLMANTITGAATLFRRDVLDFALPFPDMPGWQFHDHWLGLVAMATGEIAYVDRPLYDYVQHAGAILGQVAVDSDDAPELERARSRRPSLRGWRHLFGGWRAAYFCAYLRLEVQAQVLLARCSASLSARKRRVLTRFVGSARSPLGLAWLAARPARALFGRNETLGTEMQLAEGILWRHLLNVRVGRRGKPGRSAYDASPTPCGPDSFGQRRLRRWRARR
jgi:glycosyltransferase involved in cell wall biosynthesis